MGIGSRMKEVSCTYLKRERRNSVGDGSSVSLCPSPPRPTLTAALLPGSGSAVALVPPNNTGEPSIARQPIEGRTLTANQGTWSGSTPMSFAYRWLRCPTDGGNADGSNCAGIGGATATT